MNRPPALTEVLWSLGFLPNRKVNAVMIVFMIDNYCYVSSADVPVYLAENLSLVSRVVTGY